MKSAIVKLTQIGFSEYEARAYVALLTENPLTAYEVAKISEIPTSKIYEVIRKLEKRRTVQSIHGERSKMYVPLSPDEFIHGFRATIEDSLEAIQSELKDIKGGMDRSYTWHIRDYDGLIHKARRMINTARMNILISTWPPEMKRIMESLILAEERGVKSAVIHYGTANVKFRQLFSHPVEDTAQAERGLRGFTLVADSMEALNGTIASEKTEAIWSMNEGFVMMADGYIRHDIYQMKTMKRFGPYLKKVFGERYEKMRDVFHDEDVQST